MSTPLGDYIEQMRLRHRPPPSYRRMSAEIGLSGPAVWKIIVGKTKRPSAFTLKAIADRWGTPEDFREMMRLVGRPVTEDLDDSTPDPLVEQIKQQVKDWSIDEKQLLLSLIEFVHRHRGKDTGEPAGAGED